MSSSDEEAVEAAIERVAQSLMEAQYSPGTVQDGCLAPVWAEWVADPDPDAQSFVEAWRAKARPDPSILAAVRAEAVADAERAIRDAAASVLPPDGLTERFDLATHSAFTLAVAAVHELAADDVG